jgi:hypothetical protein
MGGKYLNYFKEISLQFAYWMYMAQGSAQWRDIVNMEMKFVFCKMLVVSC